ncbi:MAG TPA: SpoIID/LytB domain-containing protein [Blastocatellia bacterium]|nr:SpoIID/LytB domain-containing protein [Blastocatellia bacterium]
MGKVLAVLALLAFPASASGSSNSVRISLFSLFEPETVHVRLASGEGATLRADRSGGEHRLVFGETAQVRLTGGQVRVLVRDAHGRVRREMTAGEARLMPEGAAAFELKLPGRIKRVVRGELAIAAPKRGRALHMILTADRESAVASVVAAESGGRRQPEALKALAVACRTWMLAHQGRHAGEGADFCDTTHCQFYRGEDDFIDDASLAIVSVVAATDGQFLSSNGQPVASYYTSSCGGRTLTPDMVWGASAIGGSYRYEQVICSWCQNSPHYRWQRAAEVALVLDALAAATGARLSQAAEIHVEKDMAGDLARAVVIRDRGREIRMSGDEFRRAIGRRLGWNTVRSPSFTLERRGGRFIFRGRGFGSQVGLCVMGAMAQAAAGRSYREILAFYYPGAKLSGRGKTRAGIR